MLFALLRPQNNQHVIDERYYLFFLQPCSLAALQSCTKPRRFALQQQQAKATERHSIRNRAVSQEH